MDFRDCLAVAISILSFPAAAIIGGVPDGSGHPNVGALDVRPTGKTIPCSGTLVSPTVYLTAGHCADFFLSLGIQQAKVTFAPVFSDVATFHTGTIFLHPDYRQPPFQHAREDPHDVAVIVFDEPVSGVTPARLPPAGLLDALGPKDLSQRSYPVVGYGITRLLGASNGGGPPDIDRGSAGTRRSGDWRFMSLSPEWVRFDMQDARACVGDSGAPNFIGDTTIIAGIGIGGDAACRAMSSNLRLDTPAVRSFLGQFVTPLP